MMLEQRFEAQHLSNGYELVNGVEMHAENGKQFSAVACHLRWSRR